MLPHTTANFDLKIWLSDEEWSELSQDLPAYDDPVVTKYIKGREALMAEEQKRRSGNAPRISTSGANAVRMRS
jgi:hypothetical protein